MYSFKAQKCFTFRSWSFKSRSQIRRAWLEATALRAEESASHATLSLSSLNPRFWAHCSQWCVRSPNLSSWPDQSRTDLTIFWIKKKKLPWNSETLPFGLSTSAVSWQMFSAACAKLKLTFEAARIGSAHLINNPRVQSLTCIYSQQTKANRLHSEWLKRKACDIYGLSGLVQIWRANVHQDRVLPAYFNYTSCPVRLCSNKICRIQG